MTRFGSPCLEVRGVSAAYGRRQVLFDIDLPRLEGGSVLGLLGPNASGKSTLMRCLSREMAAAGGSILLDGHEQRGIAHRQWHSRVASVPQSPPAPSALRPVELMWSTARALALPLSDAQLRERIDATFAALGLRELALAPLQTLSGGKRQLVGLALGLIRDPQLLLLDEPTSALDLHWRLAVLELVRKRVAEAGGIVVAALHDLDLAVRYCDLIALIEQGRLVGAGPPQEVLTPQVLARVYRVEAEIRSTPDGRLGIDVLRPLSDGAGLPHTR